jgi:hypothetical protein
MRNLLYLFAFAYLLTGCAAHVEHLRESDCEVWTAIDKRTNTGGVEYGKMAAVYEISMEPHIERMVRVHLDPYASAILKVNTGGRGGFFVRSSDITDVQVRIHGFDEQSMPICMRTSSRGLTFTSPLPCERPMKEVLVAGKLLTHFPLNTEITVVNYRNAAITIDITMLHDMYYRELERD